MNKTIAFLACACALCGCMLAFAGCSSDSPEMRLRGETAQLLDGVAVMDTSALDAFVEHSPEGMESLRSYGVDVRNFARAYFEDFNYSIDDLQLDGSSASLTVTLKCKSIEEIEAKLYQRVAALAENPEFVKISSKEQKERIGVEIMKAAEEVRPVTRMPLTLSLEQLDGEWTFTNESKEQLDSALYGFLSENEIDEGIRGVLEAADSPEEDEGNEDAPKEKEKKDE